MSNINFANFFFFSFEMHGEHPDENKWVSGIGLVLFQDKVGVDGQDKSFTIIPGI